jgi:hypothetical protein
MLQLWSILEYFRRANSVPHFAFQDLLEAARILRKDIVDFVVIAIPEEELDEIWLGTTCKEFQRPSLFNSCGVELELFSYSSCLYPDQDLADNT